MRALQLHEFTILCLTYSLSSASFPFSLQFWGSSEMLRFIKSPGRDQIRPKSLLDRGWEYAWVRVPARSRQKALMRTDCNRREQMADSRAAKSILLLLRCLRLQAGGLQLEAEGLKTRGQTHVKASLSSSIYSTISVKELFHTAAYDFRCRRGSRNAYFPAYHAAS